MNLVTLHHVGVAYDGYEALKNVDLTIAQDDFLGIIGPNGGGKTTLVKAILGTVPHTGEVVLAPELFRGKERLIGYMPQISNFDRTFPISVLEVVLSGLQGHRGFVSRYTMSSRNTLGDLTIRSDLATRDRKQLKPNLTLKRRTDHMQRRRKPRFLPRKISIQPSPGTLKHRRGRAICRTHRRHATNT